MKNSILIMMLAFTPQTFAQESDEEKDYGTIITDRPDQTESPTVVPKGFLQVETGAFYEKVATNGFKTRSSTFNTTLLRYGLLDNLELRLGLDFLEESTKFNRNEMLNKASGLSPLALGVKIGVTQENSLLPEIGFLGHISLPFLASNDYKTTSTGVDFRFSFAHTLTEKSSLSYNLGMAWDGNSTTANYLYTIAYGYSITDVIGAYLELYGNLTQDSNFNHLWDAGLTYLIGDNIQFDISAGTGLTQNIQNLFLSAGISIRIPE